MANNLSTYTAELDAMRQYFCVDTPPLSPWIASAVIQGVVPVVLTELKAPRASDVLLYVPGLDSCSAYVIVTDKNIYIRHNAEFLPNGTHQTASMATKAINDFFASNKTPGEVVEQRLILVPDLASLDTWKTPDFPTAVVGPGPTITMQLNVINLSLAAVKHGTGSWKLMTDLFAARPNYTWASPKSPMVANN